MNSTLTSSSRTPVSLEFFPPKTDAGTEKQRLARAELYALQPQFCSVTYGAGGSTQAGTFRNVTDILNEGQQAASHFSCIGATHEKVREELQELKSLGVQRIVALRGDMPSGYGLGGQFHYASDLVAFIRAETGDHFHIEVAAYPEMHPQAQSPQQDLQALAAKVNAGANSAITQYFFNADAYFRLRDEATQLGIQIPIVPGIMPVMGASQLLRFSDACGAEVPRWMRSRLQSFGDDTESIRAFGLDTVTRLCERLIQGGVPALHFYTMNQSPLVLEISKRLNLV